MFDPNLFVDRIYEAAVVPEMWPDVLEAISGPSNAVGGLLFTTSERSGGWMASPAPYADMMRNFIACGWNDGNITRLVRSNEYRLRGGRGFFTDQDIYTPEELETDPSCAHFRSLGGGLFAGTSAALPCGDVVYIGWERNHALGPFPAETINAFNRLASHLQRSALVAGRLGLERARTAAETMRAIGLPTAVLSWTAKLLVANDLFAPLIPGVVQDRHSRLTFVDSRSDNQFEQIVGRLRSGQLYPDQIHSLPIAARHDRPPMVAHVVPIRRKAQDVFLAANSMLVITPLSGGTSPHIGLIQGLLDLTATEARVAQAIARGAQPQEIALSLGVKIGTIRTHMKAIFAKTGTSRQAELALLLSGAVL
jgi:DNA-binding CsgD family transcriptional regulator